MATATTTQTITPDELGRLLEAGGTVDLIDVRTPAEFRAVHVLNAQNIPLDTISSELIKEKRRSASHEPVYVICKSGARSRKACDALLNAGVVAVTVEGGTDACVSAGLPVSRGKQVISLERQVRIGAGSLVALGVLLSVTVSPWFLIVPGFVGGGLVFAGVTDWCGMGMVLARMPWNK